MWFPDKAHAVYSVSLLAAMQILQVTAVILQSLTNTHFQVVLEDWSAIQPGFKLNPKPCHSVSRAIQPADRALQIHAPCSSPVYSRIGVPFTTVALPLKTPWLSQVVSGTRAAGNICQ